MYQETTLELDEKLKIVVQQASALKPQFDWESLIEISSYDDKILLLDEATEQYINERLVATIFGKSFVDTALARGIKKDAIFSDDSKHFVVSLVDAFFIKVEQETQNTKELKLTQKDLYLLLEKCLLEEEAYMMAKALNFQQSLIGQDQRSGFSSQKESFPTRLIRRSGTIVTWSESKITDAVKRAFISIEQDPGPAITIAHKVTEKVRQKANTFIEIEVVQDLVQEELMRQGYYQVATQYILYRAERASKRKQIDLSQETSQSTDQSLMTVVVGRDGESMFWDGSDLRKRIEFASVGLDLSEVGDIEEQLKRAIGGEISSEDLKKTIILNAKSMIEIDADCAQFAGRILLSYIYEEVLGWDLMKDGIKGLQKIHRKKFRKYLEYAVAIGRLSQELIDGRYDLDKLAEQLDPSADFEFDFLGIQTLYDRYLIIDKTSKVHQRLETPQFFWMRVAMGLFKEEADAEKRLQSCLELYQLYKSRRFCSSTPTLFNSGTNHSQLSSCYLYTVDDSIESIMQRGIAENAYLSKWAGGLGGSWTAVRGTGGYIQGTNGESQGVIPFLKLHNDQLVAVNQGGKRRGSGCAYLETWHNDIEDFFELRKNTGDERRRCHDMNTANWIPDLFMRRMENREKWTLFRSNEVPDLHHVYGKEFEERYVHYEQQAAAGKIWSRELRAVDVWKNMLRMLFETGHPWITFKDPCNVRSPQDHTGLIHSSNLCTEITLNTSEDETAVCNLGSIILENHLTEDGDIDHDKLRETISMAVRALDSVIDINFYPTTAAKNANSRHRPIGLGVMGLQNALHVKNLAFDSAAAIEFNDEFMEAIAFYAYEASSDLAKEKGPYSTFEGSKWSRGILPLDSLELLEQERGLSINVPRNSKLDWDSLRDKIKQQGMRNSNVLAIAPTATISNIMGTTPCIEPNYKNLFVKSNLSGDFIVLNKELVKDLKKEKVWHKQMLETLKYFDGELEHIQEIPQWIKDKHKTVFSLSYQAIIDAAARRQKWIDQSQSVNLFLAEPDMKTLSHMYRHAWHTGLKTTYYLRTLAASNIEKSTIDEKKQLRGAIANDSKQKQTNKPAPAMSSCSLEALMNGTECESCQ